MQKTWRTDQPKKLQLGDFYFQIVCLEAGVTTGTKFDRKNVGGDFRKKRSYRNDQLPEV